ncbi:MAG: phosphatidylglycerophosphatase A [Deltaproteobacteria bacterium]
MGATLGAAAGGGMLAFFVATLTGADGWLALEVGALGGFVLRDVPRYVAAALAVVGGVAYGLMLTPMAWLSGALLAIVLGIVSELSRREVERSEAVDAWSPAIGWCVAVLIFFGALELAPRSVDAADLAVIVGLAAPATIAAFFMRSLFPLLGVSAFAIAAALLGPTSPALTFGLALAATAPVAAWCVRPILEIRARRIAEVGLAGAISGRLSADVCTCAGAGYTPRGSGTVGAVTALPLAWFIADYSPVVRGAVVVVLTALSILVAYRYCAGDTEDLDPSEVVFDEYIGVLIALVVVPWSWPWVIAAFVLFRFFDIAKSGPVGWIDTKMKNPAGIMLDDVVAGVLAAVVLIVAQRFV